MTLSTRWIWLAFGAVSLAMLVTYSRLAPHSLYHVSGHGIVGGGLSRVVVYLNFPVALAAIPLGLLAARRSRRWAAGIVSAVLCAVVAVPGVVSQGHLDARWVNAVPALGVAAAFALELAAGPQRVRVGPATVAAVVLLGLLSLVWLAAELGFHETFGVFLAGQPRPGYPGPVEAAVHLGHHHGLDGAMLAATALMLRRAADSRLGRAYLAALLAYGLVNCAQDAWTEQVVKRGWTTRMIPNALQPRVDAVWGVIAALAMVFYLIDRRRVVHPSRPALA